MAVVVVPFFPSIQMRVVPSLEFALQYFRTYTLLHSQKPTEQTICNMHQDARFTLLSAVFFVRRCVAVAASHNSRTSYRQKRKDKCNSEIFCRIIAIVAKIFKAELKRNRFNKKKRSKYTRIRSVKIFIKIIYSFLLRLCISVSIN